jgi:putative ABC transport system permease protein
MTSLTHQSRLGGGRGNGGLAARRAVVRWAWRMFRREWRQQLLVVALLTIAVAVAIGSITIVSNSGAEADNAAEFASASQILRFDGSDPRKLEAGLDAAKSSFGTIDVVAHRSATVPGSVEKVDYRAQDPDGPYAGELLSLRHGSYPIGPGELAVTDGVAELAGVDIGSTLALDGRRRRVVGIVENPRRLSEEFALVSPSSLGSPDYVAVFVAASSDSVDAFFESVGDHSALTGAEYRGNDHPEAQPLAMFSVTTVFMLLAALVAAAGFAVVAQRRLRQLGMLAATGATQKHLRLVLVSNGALVGMIAALCGTAAGLALWAVFAPMLESSVDHRIGRFSLPWALIAVVAVLAVLAGSAAAWWPGRTVARLPVMLALSGRPPKPRPARHSAFAAAVLIAIGIGSLALSHRDKPVFIVAGIVATILGTLLLGPLAIRVFSRVAGRLSIAPRLALRDLARYQGRSGAALAAVTLALGIAATVVIVASAEQAKKAAEPASLSDRQIRVYLGPSEAREFTPVDAPAQLDRLSTSVEQLAGRLDNATVTPLAKAFQPGAPPGFIGNMQVLNSMGVTKRFENSAGETNYRGQSQLFVATPAMLRYLGIDPASVDPSADFLVDKSLPTRGLVIPSMTNRDEFPVANVQRIDVGQHLFGSESGQTPPYFITLGALQRHGWDQIPGGWLVESSRPLTSDQINRARDIAANAGLSIEVKGEGDSFETVMAIATAAGSLLALCILALTVGLIRSESAGDLRTLTATGATSRIRRALTAATAGELALLGALLGVAGAYVVHFALYYDDLGYLGNVPVLHLALAVIGVPVAAAAAGWLLAGREPPAIARRVLE